MMASNNLIEKSWFLPSLVVVVGTNLKYCFHPIHIIYDKHHKLGQEREEEKVIRKTGVGSNHIMITYLHYFYCLHLTKENLV